MYSVGCAQRFVLEIIVTKFNWVVCGVEWWAPPVL